MPENIVDKQQAPTSLIEHPLGAKSAERPKFTIDIEGGLLDSSMTWRYDLLQKFAETTELLLPLSIKRSLTPPPDDIFPLPELAVSTSQKSLSLIVFGEAIYDRLSKNNPDTWQVQRSFVRETSLLISQGLRHWLNKETWKMLDNTSLHPLVAFNKLYGLLMVYNGYFLSNALRDALDYQASGNQSSAAKALINTCLALSPSAFVYLIAACREENAATTPKYPLLSKESDNPKYILKRWLRGNYFLTLNGGHLVEFKAT